MVVDVPVETLMASIDAFKYIINEIESIDEIDINKMPGCDCDSLIDQYISIKMEQIETIEKAIKNAMLEDNL